MPRHEKYNLELTSAQLQYLSTAFFEFGESFESAKKESMFKNIDKKICRLCEQKNLSEKFYKEKAYHKAALKAQRGSK